MKQAVIDLIDGKTPEAAITQMKDQQKELLALAGRVDQADQDITELKVDAENQGKQLSNFSRELSAQGNRVGQVETTLEETNALVEQIDQKTLSHAPFWARDVSKLMNVTDDADWRLLGSRLGYSNDDLRAWAQQADPCMAMLNEWYATRKTSEATYAVLTQMQEMNRVDASIIVENAMKNAEKIVEDDDEFEYASPPAVFISYQWGHQPEVMLLQRHLEMAGYRCWLDIGQMGGGDKLFEKIDTGIRAAKVVICCVTEKYASSPNCNREVNLSVNLKKAMIPLLLERCAWPPPGSMGPIFSEYLFIRLFKRPGEDAGLPEDERFWPRDKFHELLMQLSSMGVTHDLTEIHAAYWDWWMPVVKEINIDRSKMKNSENKAATKTAENRSENARESESPEVFISYQWGKQTSIIRLYELLTMESYSCWLDIKQMGGGDSLFDKIDRGIRGCKVVVCCVTSKYALSANCRREVGLSVALNKPIIPILLEEMAWPPTGPIGVVLAPLLYLDFRKSVGNGTVWEGESFKGLLEKISSHVPRETPSNHSTTVSNTNDQKKPESNKEKSLQSQDTSAKSTSQSKQPQVPRVDAPAKENKISTSSTKPVDKKDSNPATKKPSPESNSGEDPVQKGASRNSAPESTPESPSTSKSKSCVVL